MKKIPKLVLLCLAVVAVQACSLPSKMPDATSSTLLADKIIVVGKFELYPPLEKVEKVRANKSMLNLNNTEDYVNRIYFSATHEPVKEIDRSMMAQQWKNILDATFGETYFKQTDAAITYLNAGMAYTDATSMDKAWLPGFMSFSPPANAKAIYIGTVRYTRDDFWTITKVQVIDEYKSTLAEFRKRFGKSIRLEKSLLRKVKN